jgi:hypothetical protein
MVGGGLMQLVAYGAQDAYLTENPQISFFNTIYRRHTEFLLNKSYESEIEDCTYIYKKYELFKDKYNQNVCPICHDEYNSNDDIVIWGCQHIYHKFCHHEHIKSCPVCRHDEPYNFSDNIYETIECNKQGYLPEDLTWEDNFLTEINIDEYAIMTIII